MLNVGEIVWNKKMGTGDPGSKDSFPANNLTAGVDGETWVRTNKGANSTED